MKQKEIHFKKLNKTSQTQEIKSKIVFGLSVIYQKKVHTHIIIIIIIIDDASLISGLKISGIIDLRVVGES